MYRTIVIGGGAVGLAIANSLLDRGVQVQLVNALEQVPSASWGNAGHIAIEQVAPLASATTIIDAPRRLLSRHGGLSLPIAGAGAWLPFSWNLIRAASPARYLAGKHALTNLLSQSMPAWDRLVQALDMPHLLRRDGHFIAWNRTPAAGRNHWLSKDVGNASIKDVAAEELTSLRALSPVIASAVRCIGSGQISDIAAFLQAMKLRLTNEDRLVSARVAALECNPARVKLNDGRILDADTVIVAAGIGSLHLLQQQGFRVPMIAERGYHIQYEADDWPPDMPPIVFEDHSMIVTRFESAVRVAGFTEFSRAELPADPRKWQQLARDVEELRLPLHRRIGTWMGSRPTLPDYLPAIGRSRRTPGLFYAFGHQHLGLTTAPLTGELMAALVTGETPTVPLAPFDLERFRC